MKIYITTLFGLILLAYVFSGPISEKQVPFMQPTVYYDKEYPNPNAVISDELRTPSTLEEVAVNEMIVTKQDQNVPLNSPRFHPIMHSSAGAALVE